MGIENRAILFFGYIAKDVLAEAPEEQDYCDYLDNCCSDFKDELYASAGYEQLKQSLLVGQWSSSWECYLIGVEMGDSGNYNTLCINHEELIIRTAKLAVEMTIFFDGKVPTMYLMNLQC